MRCAVGGLFLLAAGSLGAQTLTEAREGFTTTLTRSVQDDSLLADPPPEVLTRVDVPGPLGPLAAYLSTVPKDATSLPAIVWVTGGLPPGGAGSSAWRPARQTNEQSAQAYRHAGVVMLYATLRGTHGNAGKQESFYGEVDDVLAAVDYVRGLKHVDPKRVYLGGHSTGGTLVLLAAAATDKLAGVIAFGPIDEVSGYGAESLTYDVTNDKENALRSPIRFLKAIRAPTLVIEGTQERSNLESLEALQRANTNRALRFVPVFRANHFTVLGPVNAFLAERVARLPPAEALKVSTRDIQRAFLDAGK